MPVIKLQSEDGKIFEVDVEVAKVSQTLKTMIDHLGVTDDEEIPLNKISSNILEKVLEWATHHKDDPNVLQGSVDDPLVLQGQELHIDDWDKEFLDVDQATLFDLITAANFLDIKGLCDVACKTVANLIRGRTPEEIREVMGITNDFTPEEESQIRKEHDSTM